MDEERAIDSSAWDGGAAMKACSSAADYNEICAGKKAGDPALRSSHALPHHYLGKGPNADGTRNALSRLPQTQGLINAGAAKSHLEAHLSAIQSSQKSALPTADLFRAVFPGAEVRDVSDGQPVLHGHFARFNEWAEIDSMFEGRFLERIAPGAFAASFADHTPKVLFQHGRDAELGDKVLGSPVTVGEDDEGASYEVPLFPSVPPLLVDGLRAGAYGASFRFSVTREDINREPKRSNYNPEGLPERTITEANVAEFGPVTFPAYAGATAGVRSATDRFRIFSQAELDMMILKMVNDHPKELAAKIERAMKVTTEEKPLEEKPPVNPRFRTREEYLQWLLKS